MTEGVRPRTQTWDSALWPSRAWILFFALLLRTPHHGVVAQMRATGLPEGATEVEAAVWGVLVAESERLQMTTRGNIPSSVRWLDAHGREWTRGLLTAGILLLAGLLSWGIFHREGVRSEDAADLERRARQASAEGDYQRAAVLYGQAAQRGRETYYQYRQAGEWMRLGQADTAEAAYRKILVQEPESPNVQLNLALAVYRQGRREEALALYRAFVDRNKACPELAARAQLASELIERQIDLDRE